MSDQTITIRSYYERTVRIDDAAGEPVSLPVRIRRFTKEQLRHFLAAWEACQRRPLDRLLVRRAEGDEQERRPITLRGQTIETFVVGDEEIMRRRREELTPEARAALDAEHAVHEASTHEFYAQIIREHVSVQPRVRLVFEDEHGASRDLRTGDDLVTAFAGQFAICAALALAVYQENTLSADEKKRWRSLSDLLRSSSAPIPTAAGAAPDGTAAPAAPTASAPSAAATDASVTSPSGSTVM